MKRILKASLSILLCVVMIFGTAPLSGFKDMHLPKGILSNAFETVSGWIEGLQPKLSASALEIKGKCGILANWTFDESNGKLTITGRGAIEKNYNGWDSFKQRIVFVEIERSIHTIGTNAFANCINLKYIVIPTSVEKINSGAFSNCPNLKYVYHTGDEYTWSKIKHYEQYNLKNTTIYTLRDAKNRCGENAFWSLENGKLTICGIGEVLSCPSYSNNIISIEFLEGINYINCNINSLNNLKEIIIPGSVTRIRSGILDDCKSLENIIVSPDNKVFNSNNNCNAIIETNAHKIILGCKNTIIPDNTLQIGDYAFRSCIGLTSIVIPKYVKLIGVGPFTGCLNLTSIIVHPNNAFYCSDDEGVLYNKDKTKIIQYPCGRKSDSYSISEGVKEIGNYAFWGCKELENIVIPDSVTQIGGNAFNGTGFFNNTDNWENGVLYINNKLIMAKYSISGSYFIKNGTQTIAANAFHFCTELTSVTIPDSVTSIGYEAFSGCTGLTSVTIENGVTSIGNYAFYGCTGLTSITIPASVTSIGSYAFYGCTGLTSITIPASVTSIGSSAFRECTGLTSITIPASVTSIGYYAFYGCTGLTSITIPDSVTSIGYYAFYGCTGLISITIPDSVTSIGYYAFYGCTGLTSITISDSVTSIDHYTFSECTSLVSIALGNSIKSIGNSAFKNCTSLTSITIPNSVTGIYDYAFYGCTGLTSITIPNSVKLIENLSFYSVNNIIYSDSWYNNVMRGYGSPWGAKAVDAYVEDGLYYYDSSKELLLACSANAPANVVIPSSVEEVGENCFNGCDKIETLSFSSPVYFSDTAVVGCENLQTIIAPENTDSFGVIYTKPIYATLSTGSVSKDDLSIEHNTDILFCNRSASGSYTVSSNITKICDNAFANCKYVSVSIPDSVHLKSIGANAFLNSQNYNNDSNWIDNVLVIGNYLVTAKTSISGTYSLTSTVKGIADNCFAECSSLTGFNFGSSNNLRFLGSKVFSGCSSTLKSNITLPTAQNLEYVGEGLFDSHEEAESPKSTEYIGTVLVSVSPDVENLTIEQGTTVIAAGAFSGCTKLKSIVIPDTVKKIDKNTFNGCTNLSSVTFEGDITEIGRNAFSNCFSLTQIAIPASVTEIEPLAFYGCTGMKEFIVDKDNNNYKSVDGVLMSKDGKIIIQYPAAKISTEYSIPDNTFVSDFAFYRCRNLKKITLGEGIEYGNRNPFAACTAGFNFDKEDTNVLFGDTDYTILKSVSASTKGTFVIPDTVTEIGSDAFRECFGITAIDFSEAYELDTIGSYAFYGCTGLTSITIPSKVKTIGESAFENCVNLREVIFTTDKGSDKNIILSTIGDNAFCNCECNTKDGYCNKDVLDINNVVKVFYNYSNYEDFKNPFFDSVKLDEPGFIYGLRAGLTDISEYIYTTNKTVNIYCNTEKIGTGSSIILENILSESDTDRTLTYTAIIFGDVNGDGWYDGMDSIIVNMIANGMLKKEQVSKAVWMAADCNHDGEINSSDVLILEQAGLLLANVDQSKSSEKLKTDSNYLEYLNLIDQTPTVDESAEKSETNVTNIFQWLMNFIIKILDYFKLHFIIIR